MNQDNIASPLSLPQPVHPSPARPFIVPTPTRPVALACWLHQHARCKDRECRCGCHEQDQVVRVAAEGAANGSAMNRA